MSDGFALVGVKSCGCATRAMVDDEHTQQKDRAQDLRDAAEEDGYDGP